MSYMVCQKCGGMFGVIGNTVYTCGCVPPIPQSPEAVAGNASAPVGESQPRFRKVVEWLHMKMAAAQNQPYEDGDVCLECADAVRDELRPLMERALAGQPSGVGEPREALCEALDCIGENIDIAGTEWADRPMKQWMSEWRAALSTPSQTEGASSPADAHPERVETAPREVGEGLREALDARQLLERAYINKFAEGWHCTWCKQRNTHSPDCPVAAALAAPAPKPANKGGKQ